MKSFTTIASISLSVLPFLPAVLGHGHMTTLLVDGTNYTGPDVGQQTDAVIRMINTVSPVLDVTSDDLSCGQGAGNETATQIAQAKAGSKIGFSWISGSPPILWPHNMGPLMTYMASCEGNCTSFNSVNAKWIKVDEAGEVNNGTNGDFVQNETYHQGKSYSFTLPSDLANGQYLIRHEIIALHNAQTVGLAEFYPACAQVEISGSSSQTSIDSLPSEYIATFPGTYSATDPGIHIDVYGNTNPYPFPGPAVVTSLAAAASGSTGSTSSSGSGSYGNSSDDGNSATTSATGSATPASATPGAATQSPTTTSAMSAAASQTDDCDAGDGSDDDDDDDDDTVTVTITETVTATPHAHHTKTDTAFVTITAAATSSPAVAADAADPEATTTLNRRAAPYAPRQRSRIMGRRYWSGANVHA